MPILSVVIPCYNASSTIEECVLSVMDQSLTDLEIIVVDDGSTDDSLAICRRLAEEDERISVYTKKNAGQGIARNFGMSHATGEYIAFVDADDTVENNMYEQMYLRAESEKADFVICNTRCYINDKDDFIETSNSPLSLNICTENDLLYLFNNGGLGSWDKLFRTDLVRDIRFNVDISNYEDYLFNFNRYF